MPNSISHLHSAARRYCINRHQMWCSKYEEFSNSSPEEIKLTIFPRYLVAEAIRIAIERYTPSDFKTEAQAREQIAAAGETAQTVMTQRGFGRIGDEAAQEERRCFVDFIRVLDSAEASKLPLLFFRRTLSTAEAESIRHRLNDRWRINNGYWYPVDVKPDLEIEAFESHVFFKPDLVSRLHRLLEARSIDRIWEIREGEPHCEVELTAFEPIYDGREGFWSSEGLDWIVYASHESSVTIGGWLLPELKVVWPEWALHLYESAN